MIDSAIVEMQIRRDRRLRLGSFALLFVVLLMIALVSLASGPLQLSVREIFSGIVARFWKSDLMAADSVGQMVIWEIRLPRIINGILVGAVLAASGAVMQGLFRNPLADPGLIGVSSGAAVGAVAAIGWGGGLLVFLPEWLGGFLLPLCAFAGSCATCFLIFRISKVDGEPVVSLMLLTGIAMNALASAIIGMFIFFSNDDQLRTFTFWSLGSLGRANWSTLFVVVPLMLIPTLLYLRFARPLKSLVFGEAEAYNLEILDRRVKRALIVLSACGVGAAVSAAGMIGFVGLVVPHLMRMMLGSDHRFLLPGSALAGAVLLLAADLFARIVAMPAELPIGVVTALIGAPFFLFVLHSNRLGMSR